MVRGWGRLAKKRRCDGSAACYQGPMDSAALPPWMFETHVREEFSTFAWVLEGMIERAGLRIVSSDFPAPWYGEFIAAKDS